jgi:phage terminase large subunit-like protein
MMFNEASQIPKRSRDIALTRLAQKVNQKVGDIESTLMPRSYVDTNPPTKGHWSYQYYIAHIDPETRRPLEDPHNYVALQMNPIDNKENLSEDYLSTLEGLSARLRMRFLDGIYAEENPYALFNYDDIEKWRITDGRVPDLILVVVAVDPSGARDIDNAANDEIGITVVGLGVDGNAYLLEDCSCKAGPAVWGRVAVGAFERREANIVVGEENYGGAMVEHVIQTARPRTPYENVRASRGKTVRAEPFSALYEQGKVRHVGKFALLEDELCAMSTYGYMAQGSPNRADSLIWALAKMFPNLVKDRSVPPPQAGQNQIPSTSWMAN